MTFTHDQSIPERFRQVAERFGDCPAVVEAAGTLTYAALADRADHLTAALLAAGVEPGDRIGLRLPDDATMIAGWLGTLATGAICVPLALGQPVARHREILAHAEPKLLITSAALAPEAPAGFPLLVLDELPASLAPVTTWSSVDPDSPAYLLYTSGTTGQPKGVIQTHRNQLRNVLVLSELMELDSADRLIGMTAFSMGQGIATLFIALLNGLPLHPYPLREAGLAGLPAWMREQEISIYTSSVSVFRQFLGGLAPEETLPRLRVIRLGAEELRPADVELFQARFPTGCTLYNTLGASETMNYARYRITAETVVGDIVPVGEPPLGTALTLEDGEIVVHSRFLSPGYWREPELTAARFGRASNGTRFYHTGDRGRFRADGALEFLGRADNQVKIRGNRVELGEIESALRRHPEISDAVVEIRGEDLAAHVQTTLPEPAIRAFLADLLPAFMVPASILVHPDFPLTPSGKIDRQALRGAVSLPADRPEAEGPANDLERALAACWERVLGREKIGVNADFYSLGGNSLLAMRLFVEIRAATGLEFTAANVLSDFTIARMAAGKAAPERLGKFLARISGTGTAEPVVFIPGGWGGDNEILCMEQIARGLQTARPVLAIRSRVLDPQWPGAASLAEHAAAVWKELRKLKDLGRWTLIGECVACPLAVELAALAATKGLAPGRVILLDPWVPPPRPWFTAKPPPPARSAELPAGVQAYYHLLKSARPRPIRANLDLVLASDSQDQRRITRHWRQFTKGRLNLHRVSGTHETYIREDLAETRSLLNRLLFSS